MSANPPRPFRPERASARIRGRDGQKLPIARPANVPGWAPKRSRPLADSPPPRGAGAQSQPLLPGPLDPNMNWTPVLLLLHVAAAVAWVGGMFFAYQCLRPAAAQLLEPPERLRLWCAVFGRFFPWVWAAIVVLPATGLSMMLAVGMGAAPLHWRLMMLTGLVMIAIFLAVFLVPYRRLQRAVAAEDWKSGGAALARIRQLVGLNLLLGVLTIAIATAGRLIG
jgi:uncharacterized membrane protein